MQSVDDIQRLSNKISVSLQWEGKSEAVAMACSVAGGTLIRDPLRSLSKSLKNLVIEADNLPALKLLRTEYSGSVSLIYIDPPYNTGHKFHYLDRYDSHARWLSMMLPRLSVARDLLSENGIICISIDDNEIGHLRLLMDEIFGEDNYVGQVTVLSNPRGRQAEKHLATVHEYVLIYAKNASRCRLHGLQLNDEQLAEFNKIDEHGRRYRLLGLRQRGAASRQEDRPALHYPVYIDPKSGAVSTVQSKGFDAIALPKKSTGAPGRWMWCRETLEEKRHVAEGKLIAKRNEWDVFVRDYADSEDGTVRTRKISSVWNERQFNYQNGKRELKELLGECPVEYPKPTALIQRCIDLMNDPDALVLDFFAGSGTCGHAVVNANTADGGNRSFILIQTAEPIANKSFATITDVLRSRLLRLAETSPAFARTGFSYLTLKP